VTYKFLVGTAGSNSSHLKNTTLEKESFSMAYPYMVSVTGSNAPRQKHSTIELAQAEAERLARQPQNVDRVIHVVEIVATLAPKTTHEWVNA
jgi:hypothetical protein